MYVQGFHATAADGSVLVWRKTDEQTWRIELDRATSVNVTYQLSTATRFANNHAQYNEKLVHRRSGDLDVSRQRQGAPD